MEKRSNKIMEKQIQSDSPQPQSVLSALRAKPKRSPLSKLYFGMILSVFLLLTIGIVALVYIKQPQEIRQKAEGTGIVMSLQPATKTVQIGDTFSLEIWISANATQQVSGAKINLHYDTSAINVTEFTVASQAASLPMVIVPPVIANGMVTVTVSALPSSPTPGTLKVGTLKVKAITAGRTALNFSDTTGANVVTMLHNIGNALSAKTGSIITIQTSLLTPSPVSSLHPNNRRNSNPPVCGRPWTTRQRGVRSYTAYFRGSGFTGAGTGVDGYRWDFDGNGTWDTNVLRGTVSHTYQTPGTYTPKYQVHGTNGVWSKVCTYPQPVVVLTPTPSQSEH
jgi:hypothetical protein